MKKFIIQAIVLIIIIFAGLYFSFANPASPLVPISQSTPTQSGKVVINDTQIDIEVADTPSKRQKGLGGRQSLASSSGMLFVFDKEDRYQFWMKGLNFPLDFIWIKDNTVVDLLKDVPPPQPNQKDETLPIYVPNQTVNRVLEVNGGFIDTHQIKVGDKVGIR